MYTINMSTTVEKRRQRIGALFGLAAGFTFAVACWGFDAFALTRAHVDHSLIKFIPGLIICLASGALTGWLGVRLKQAWLGVLAWLGFAVFLTWLILSMPVQWSGMLIRALEGEFAALIYFPNLESVGQLWFFGLFVTALPCLFCGIFETTLVESALASSSKAAVVFPMLASAVLLAFSGFAGDHLLNSKFRQSIVALDDLLEFASVNYGQEVDPQLARKMHYSTVNELGELVLQPYAMTLMTYETTLGRMEILVNFSGQRAQCTVIYSQPVRCKPLQDISFLHSDFPPPWS